MRKSFKAPLFSAFAFPGCGHFFLKKYIQAAVLSGITLFCLYILITTTLDITDQITLKIQSGALPLDINMIREEILAGFTENATAVVKVSYYLIVITWILGILDAYRIGRSQDKIDLANIKKIEPTINSRKL